MSSANKKGTLILYVQQSGRQIRFDTFRDVNSGLWVSAVFINEIEYGRGTEPTAKGAEEAAAIIAFRVIEHGEI